MGFIKEIHKSNKNQSIPEEMSTRKKNLHRFKDKRGLEIKCYKILKR